MDLFSAPENLVFAVCFALMAIIALSELASMLLGFGLSDFIENALPDFGDLPDMDVDLGPEAEFDTPQTSSGDIQTADGIGKLLSWLGIGKVPVLISLSLFLFLISLLGFTLQSIIHSAGLPLLPRWIAVVPVFIISIPCFRWGNGLLGKIWPKDETSAISDEKFIGQIARITIGSATSKKAAEAKLTGPDGKTHYIMIIADNENEILETGQDLLITRKKGHVFTAVINTNPNLSY